MWTLLEATVEVFQLDEVALLWFSALYIVRGI